MAATSLRAALLLLVLAVSGCSKSDMWPMLTGEPRRADRPAATPSADVTSAPLPATSASMTSYAAPASGTFVGQQVQQLRGDLQRLQAQVAEHRHQADRPQDPRRDGQRIADGRAEHHECADQIGVAHGRHTRELAAPALPEQNHAAVRKVGQPPKA